jgi:acetylornithine/succinyldiaminopimelate/putrescine aminotransferase
MTNRQLFLQHVAQTSDAPLALEIVRAEGQYLWDASGKRYLDLIAGISVCNVGHSHPAVVAAVQRQAAEYMHLMVYGEFVESPQVQYAAMLTDHLPAPLDSVYFTNSGAEAVEGAMKLAKRLTGRPGMAAFEKDYHGSTQGALSLIGGEYWRQAYRPLLPGIMHLRYDNDTDLDRITEGTAAVIAETVQGEAGVIAPRKEWLQGLRQRCDQTGALLILDEVQAGLGRTGSLWAFEQYDIVPDVLVLGKALGGGMPRGAFIAARQKMSVLTREPVLGHLTTFGGHPVCCAAGMAAFSVLTAEALSAGVPAKERLFRERLRHPRIRQLRARGLMIALSFDSFDTNKKVIDRCIRQGVLTDWFLFAPESMRIAPPLTITLSQIEEACTVILQAVESA